MKKYITNGDDYVDMQLFVARFELLNEIMLLPDSFVSLLLLFNFGATLLALNIENMNKNGVKMFSTNKIVNTRSSCTNQTINSYFY